MKVRDSQNTVRSLAAVAESETPFVSCHTSLERDPRIARAELGDRLLTPRACVEPDQPVDFEHALSPIMAFLSSPLARFIEHEQQESVTRVAQLMDEPKRGRLAAADSAATLEALQRGQVDVLVIAKRYEPPAGWACQSCRFVDQADHPSAACPVCSDRAAREADLKAEKVRLAKLHGVEVEVLRESDALNRIGGSGSLLKYRRPGQYCQS